MLKKYSIKTCDASNILFIQNIQLNCASVYNYDFLTTHTTILSLIKCKWRDYRYNGQYIYYMTMKIRKLIDYYIRSWENSLLLESKFMFCCIINKQFIQMPRTEVS